MSLKS